MCCILITTPLISLNPPVLTIYKKCVVKYNFDYYICMILHRTINTYHSEVSIQKKKTRTLYFAKVQIAIFHSRNSLLKTNFIRGSFVQINAFP